MIITVLRRFSLCLALLLAHSTLLLAAGQAVTIQSLAGEWRTGLKEVDQKLRDRQWAAAQKQAKALSYQIVEGAGTGDGATYSLAVVSAFQAFAAAGLGESEDAEWFWDTALNLFPDIAKTDVSPYGPAAAGLKTRTLRPVEPGKTLETIRLIEEKGGELNARPVAEPGTPHKVTPPRIVRQPRPDYPKALALLKSEGVVVVSAVIDSDGRPRRPVVVNIEGGGPAMELVALDSVRQWRFEPAKLKGQPVAVEYVLVVRFQVKH